MNDEQNEVVDEGAGDIMPDETAGVPSETTSEQADAVDDETTAGQSEGSRTMARVIFYLVFLVVAGVLGIEGVARFTHAKSIGSLEQAFQDQPKSGLTLTEARRHVSGMVTMTTRNESSKMAVEGSVQYAVFQWFSLLQKYQIELEIGKSEAGEMLVKSQPYVPVKVRYKIEQPAEGGLLESEDAPESSGESKTETQPPGEKASQQPSAKDKTKTPQ